MLRMTRRWSLVAVLAVAVMLGPALPAVASPTHATHTTVLSWLQGWLPWSRLDGTDRAIAPDEAFPAMDPDGTDAVPTLSQLRKAQTPTALSRRPTEPQTRSRAWTRTVNPEVAK